MHCGSYFVFISMVAGFSKKYRVSFFNCSLIFCSFRYITFCAKVLHFGSDDPSNSSDSKSITAHLDLNLYY